MDICRATFGYIWKCSCVRFVNGHICTFRFVCMGIVWVPAFGAVLAGESETGTSG